jgi:hypothetical protein
MATDDFGQNDPSSLPVPQNGEQRQSDEPQLHAYGVPVQDRAVKGRATAVLTGCLICAIVPAVLAIVEGIYHDVPATLVWLGVIIGFLPGGMGEFTERWHEKIQKKIQFGKVGRRIFVAQ